jgi:hypothetical protein
MPTDGQTDMTKLVLTLGRFSNAPKNIDSDTVAQKVQKLINRFVLGHDNFVRYSMHISSTLISTLYVTPRHKTSVTTGSTPSQ